MHFELLLDLGADPNGVSAGGDCRSLVLETPTDVFNPHERSYSNFIQVLLNAGAAPNPHGSVLTPLQIATIYYTGYVVEELLWAGADANAVGDDEAVVAAIQRDCSTEAPSAADLLN